ncbi:ParB/Srx family N-terminal domain-containing protein [Pedobacter sp. P26]|uniref:ParB/Srx family N-terminal domain-containing protein n=1 Tax=Pedobacter sp. P26 TaxID=3423956 RepID=UPI003D67D9A9
MIDYSQWQRKKLQVKSLKLDDENPRLSGFGSSKPTQNQVVEYMLEYEKVIQLAKDIAKMGFLPNEEPIVFKENNRYVVVEGNRRVTACKVLVDPDLIPKKTVNMQS